LHKSRLVFLLIFSVAMALVEAAAVIYLRQQVPFATPLTEKDVLFGDLSVFALLKKDVMAEAPRLRGVEQAREIATLVMLLAVAALAGVSLREKLLSFLYSFAVWDLFYYISLNALVGWPASLFDQDVFFLLPVPWAGPVITPIASSIIAIFISAFLLSSEV